MSIESLIYLAGIVGDLKGALLALGILFLTGFMIYLIFISALRADQSREKNFGDFFNEHKKNLKLYPHIALLVIVLSTLIPDQRTVYLIAGSGIAKQMIESPDAKKLYKKTYDLIDSKLDDLLNSNKKSNEKADNNSEK